MIVRTRCLLEHQKWLVDSDGAETPTVKALAPYKTSSSLHITRKISQEHGSCVTCVLWSGRIDWKCYHPPLAKFCLKCIAAMDEFMTENTSTTHSPQRRHDNTLIREACVCPMNMVPALHASCGGEGLIGRATIHRWQSSA